MTTQIIRYPFSAAPTITLSMSEKGQISRILSNKYGGYLTFAALSPEKASAPGQPTIQQLSKLYNFQKQNKVRLFSRARRAYQLAPEVCLWGLRAPGSMMPSMTTSACIMVSCAGRF